jgi:hypothetical protein
MLVACGWQVKPADPNAPFAVDLVGSIRCPVCHRPIRAAVCCGAHIYRCDREIREFHDATVNDFHVRLYIHPATSRLTECCRSFGIQLIDPHSYPVDVPESNARRLSPIAVAVAGHDRLEPVEIEASSEHDHSRDKRERG